MKSYNNLKIWKLIMKKLNKILFQIKQKQLNYKLKVTIKKFNQ